MKDASMIKCLAIPLLALAPLSVAAAATPVDNYAASDIANARYDAAIEKLERDFARSPEDESTLLNLALAYRYSGRASEAVPLYRRVLSMQDYELGTVTGDPVWAHQVARRALDRQVQFSSR